MLIQKVESKFMCERSEQTSSLTLIGPRNTFSFHGGYVVIFLFLKNPKSRYYRFLATFFHEKEGKKKDSSVFLKNEVAKNVLKIPVMLIIKEILAKKMFKNQQNVM